MAEIWSYVAAEASEAIATRLIQRIEAACEPMRCFPEAGASRERLAPGLRATFEGHYALYYRHDETTLTIIRVLHGARDAVALAARGGFE